jgi:hypothetical protein
MIPVAFDLSELRVSSLSRRLEGGYAPEVSQVEICAPERVVASDPDPVEEWMKLGRSAEFSTSTLTLPLLDLAWTSEHEKRFLRLAGREATGELGAEDKAELEQLTGLRRGLRNPRRGEELLWEYEQRELTRDLVSALSRYVTFHNPPGHSKPSQA